MKNEFVTAITQLSAEKNLNADTVFAAVEAAMASSFKNDLLQYANVETRIDRQTGDVEAWQTWSIVDDDEIEDDEIELSPERARALGFGNVELGQIVRRPLETTPETGRIAAQTAKQVVLQRLREAERDSVFEDFTGKEGEIVSGTVLRVERGRQQVILDLGRTEAVLPYSEQIRVEHYRVDQRLRVYVKEVYRATRGPQVLVSRAAPDLLKRLLELEVPEIARGIVEIMGVARDPGFRTKVAVISRQPGVDPIGAVVGVRGARIQNVVNELSGERVDVIRWDPNALAFAANALSPAEVVSIRIDAESNTAYVAVPDRQLSLAIGKEGQNARLAARLTGLRIDIRGEGQMISGGEDLYPPPEPNMESIPLPPQAPPAPVPAVAVAPAPAGVAPAQPPEAVPAAVEPEPAVPEIKLTPEQELIAEFAEQEEPVAETTVAEPPAERVVAPPSEREAPSVLRFADEIRELRLAEEEERERERERRRGRRRSGGATQPRPERRRGRQDFEYDEDEIEAALHGEDYYENYEDELDED